MEVLNKHVFLTQVFIFSRVLPPSGGLKYFFKLYCFFVMEMLIMCLKHIFFSHQVHIQNSTLAGGVAVGTAAEFMLSPYGSLIVGFFCGVISTLGYIYISVSFYLLESFYLIYLAGIVFLCYKFKMTSKN